MFERIWRMLTKEFLQVFRDRRMKAVIFVMPIVQVLVFGYAVTTDVRNVATAVVDRDGTASSRELLDRFSRSGYFDLAFRPETEAEVRGLLDRGDAAAVIRIDPGFEADLRAGRTARVQLLLDGTDSNTAGIVLDYAGRIAGEYSRRALVTRRARLTGDARAPATVEIESRAWFNENLESRNFYVPGVIAIIIMLITLMLTSMAVVREKEVGTMEQIIVTPIRPVEFILGKTLPFALIGFVDACAVAVVGVLWFKVPMVGSLTLLLGATVLYLMTTLGLGLFISTVSRTQQQAMMSTFFFYLPAVLLSGFLFPIRNMPEAVQAVTYLNPLRYFLVVLRGVFLKGVGPVVLWPQLAALAAMGVTTLWLASRRFRKTL